MLKAQTLQPTHIELVNQKGDWSTPDITLRYRMGYDWCRNKNFDLIAFIENDDWYHPEYFEEMIKAWDAANRPDIFGTNYTIWYHLAYKKWYTYTHIHRCMAMSTFIKPDLNFRWPANSDPFTDVWLWNEFRKKQPGGKNFTWAICTPPKHLCMGMKHGIGLCGTKNHTDPQRAARFKHDDADFAFLKETMAADTEAIEFYINLHKQLTA